MCAGGLEHFADLGTFGVLMGPHPPSIAIEESVEINLLALEALLSKPLVKVSL